MGTNAASIADDACVGWSPYWLTQSAWRRVSQSQWIRPPLGCAFIQERLIATLVFAHWFLVVTRWRWTLTGCSPIMRLEVCCVMLLWSRQRLRCCHVMRQVKWETANGRMPQWHSIFIGTVMPITVSTMHCRLNWLSGHAAMIFAYLMSRVSTEALRSSRHWSCIQTLNFCCAPRGKVSCMTDGPHSIPCKNMHWGRHFNHLGNIHTLGFPTDSTDWMHEKSQSF